MAGVTVRLPAVLAQVVGGTRTVQLEAPDVSTALKELVRIHPRLAVHLFDETGDFRVHVRCFHGEKLVPGARSEAALRDGDELTILQSVSGG